MLDRRERWLIGTRLVLALVSGFLLLLAMALRWLRPEEAELAHWVAMIAALLVSVPVFTAAYRALWAGGLHGTTDVLVALALVAAWVTGDLETAALVPLAMVVGHAIEERSLLGSQEALKALTALTAGRARRLDACGQPSEVSGAELRVDDRIELRSGDRCPADGVVDSGRSSADSAPITGESVPQDLAPGDRILAGAVNMGGRLVVRVERIGGDTALGRVVALMQDAERAKPEIARLLDRFAGAYLLLVILVAALIGFATGSTAALMATLVAACPCALVVAAPATAVAAIAAGARRGILVKGTAFLERLADCDCVVFDKTGTLTEGELRVLDGDALPADARQAAATLGACSSHPVSAGRAPDSRRLPLPPAAAVAPEAPARQGIAGEIAGRRWLLGRSAYLADQGVAVPAPRPEPTTGPISGVAGDGRFVAWLRMADVPRAHARAALQDLRSLGLARQVLCSGDRQAAADRVARDLGIDEVHAEALPAHKLKRIRQEAAAGRRTAVVGDGINDALALRAGAVGIAMGGRASDLAIASADIVLVDGDLRRLGAAVRLSRACRASIMLGIAIAAAWTLMIVALAACGLVSPFGAAVLHNVGTVAVILNAGRLIGASVA